jgi:hypothetical protein
MTFEETVRLFTDNVGKTVDVSVGQAIAEREEPTDLAGFSGRIESVKPSVGGAWRVWLDDADRPMPGTVLVDPGLFDGADVQANVMPEFEERNRTGSTWTLTVHQRDVVIAVEFYV